MRLLLEVLEEGLAQRMMAGDIFSVDLGRGLRSVHDDMVYLFGCCIVLV